jgi:uncharacterized membrane protein
MKKNYPAILISSVTAILLQAGFAANAFACPTGPGIFIAILAFIFAVPILIILLLIVVLSILSAKKVIKGIEKNKEPMTFQKASNILERTRTFLIIYFISGIILAIVMNVFDIKLTGTFKTFLTLLGFLALLTPSIYVYCLFGEKIIQKLQAMRDDKITELKYFTKFLAAESILKTFIAVAVLTIEVLAYYYLYKLL